MKNLMQNILIVGGLLVLMALGYYLYTQNQISSLQSSDTNNATAVNASLFIQQMNEVKAIELDATVLNDPRFRNLRDYSEPITPLPIGKPNPFVR